MLLFRDANWTPDYPTATAVAQSLFNLDTALEEKHILISLNDPAAMTLLAEVGWVGAMEPGNGDYLMVVDSNVGWNKANAAVDRQTAHHSHSG